MMQKIRMKRALMGIICVLLMMTTFAATAYASTEQITFTLYNSYSGGLKEIMMNEIVQNIKEYSDGRIQAQLLAAGTMGNDREAGEAIQLGTLDMCWFPDVVIDSLVGGVGWAFLPYMFTTNEDADKYYNNGWIREKLDAILAENGMICVALAINGFRHYGSRSAPVRSLSDFRGQKARVPEQADMLRFYELCGALPVAIAGSEALTALEQGTIDGADNTLYNLWDTGLLDSLKYVTLLSYQYSACRFIASENFWGKLSDTDREIVTRAVAKACDIYSQRVIAQEKALIEEYSAKGVEFIYPDEAFSSELKAVGVTMWNESADKYDPAIMERIRNDFGSN